MTVSKVTTGGVKNHLPFSALLNIHQVIGTTLTLLKKKNLAACSCSRADGNSGRGYGYLTVTLLNP